MVPVWTASGVLPPYLGTEPTASAAMSPYEVSASAFVKQFATSDARKTILQGWLKYRADLRDIGILTGFQWLDGSFVEDCETHRGRPPDDLDLVTFAPMPQAVVDVSTRADFLAAHGNLFLPEHLKKVYRCHSFFVALNIRADLLVESTRFYFGLFSHQRVTAIWKGMLKVSLASDDAAALALLQGGPSDAA